MLGLEIVVVLGVAVLVCTVAAGRLRVVPPVLLVVVGVAVGFIPALREVSLPPETMLLVFLPALLYWESLTTSLREIRNNLRIIVLASTVLVVVTAAAVAAVAHAVGMPWGPAWILGAAIAPTDATVVGVIARALPLRTMTVLRAESLVNDGTALVIYGIAVSVTQGGGSYGPGHVSWLFVLAYVGGAASGLLTAWLAIQARRRLDSPTLENVVSVLTPFVAFLLAERLEASGVLAVVVCGLVLSQIGPRIVRADTRQQANAFWGLTTFLLNGSLFVLIGLQANAAVRDLSSSELTRALTLLGIVTAVVIGARFVYNFTTPYVIRAIDRRPQQRLRRAGPRPRVVMALSGFRGAVSMAAALAVPELTNAKDPFPDRDVIIFVTAGVIVLTLVIQSVILPFVVHWAHLPPDTQLDEERSLAITVSSEEAFEALPRLAAELEVDPMVLERTQTEYQRHLTMLRTEGAGEDDIDDTERRLEDEYKQLRLALLARKRETLLRLRDERLIDDIVVREVQSKLDVEEVRLSRREIVE
ncbi:Na+/H+ antiporter [Actinocrispum sp. NPDC049592]|uniref:Na+/H+ antiporter n=1 Tax=Actinocrispum sp. NPDC049592 TaxID=3154835 RepID=UPI00342668D4